MPRFFIGDELGLVKSLRYNPELEKDRTELRTIHSTPKANPIQALDVTTSDATQNLAVTHADGSAYYLSITDDKPKVLHEWSESRLKPGQKFVGLKVSDRGVFSCTSNGALRVTNVRDDTEIPSPQLASLPACLRDWRLSHDEKTFAYGGCEVDLSVWDTDRAFSARSDDTTVPTTKKRKRKEELHPGEVWRAKNVPNDFLNLRQPVHITSLIYLSSSLLVNQHNLLAGTHSGDVRRYDTRAARQPVAIWKDIGRQGGVRVMEKGLDEHELFVADCGCNLFSVDLRTGRLLYSYRGISSTVVSLAPSPSILASVDLGRSSRVYSTFPPPPLGKNLEKRGEVLENVYLKSTPNVIVWDQELTANPCVTWHRWR